MFATRAARPMIAVLALAGLTVLFLTPTAAVAQSTASGWEAITYYHTHAVSSNDSEGRATVFDLTLAGSLFGLVPAPAAVRVEPPELEVVDLEEVEIRPVLRRPELPRPQLGTLIVRIPPAPGPVHVEPPTIDLPDLEEAKIAPVLRLPASAGRTKRAEG